MGRVALTEGGADLLASLAPALAQIRASVEWIHTATNRPSGQLRINTSGVAYAALIEPHVRPFNARYPDIVLDIQIDNGVSELGPGGRFLEWEFTRKSKSIAIHVDGRLVFNEMPPALAAARNGCGLAYVFRQFATADLGEKRLTVVLERHTRPSEAFHLYYPSRAQMPGKLRAFIDFIRAAN